MTLAWWARGCWPWKRRAGRQRAKGRAFVMAGRTRQRRAGGNSLAVRPAAGLDGVRRLEPGRLAGPGVYPGAVVGHLWLHPAARNWSYRGSAGHWTARAPHSAAADWRSGPAGANARAFHRRAAHRAGWPAGQRRVGPAVWRHVGLVAAGQPHPPALLAAAGI